MTGFTVNSNTTSNLSNDAAIRILNAKDTISSPGLAVTEARVSTREFKYEQSGETYFILNTKLMTEQQSLKALFLIQNGMVADAANAGLSTNVSASIADMVRENFQVSFEVEEVERETKSESFSYFMNAEGKVEKIAVPTGSAYKTLQIVAKSIRPFKKPAAIVSKKFTFELPVAVDAPVINKKTNEEVILDFEAAGK
jgi:hypothetical protein